MGTRSGDVDPGLLGYLAEQTGRGAADLTDVLDTRSGLLGLSGASNDMRTISEAAEQGDERAGLALDVFVHRLAKAVAGLTASLGGLDALVFTAGIGENSVRRPQPGPGPARLPRPGRGPRGQRRPRPDVRRPDQPPRPGPGPGGPHRRGAHDRPRHRPPRRRAGLTRFRDHDWSGVRLCGSYRVLISGRVQGVFFRDSCRRLAEEHDVAGWVRNLPDGRVEAVFEGPPDDVRLLVDWARHGPRRPSSTTSPSTPNPPKASPPSASGNPTRATLAPAHALDSRPRPAPDRSPRPARALAPPPRPAARRAAMPLAAVTSNGKPAPWHQPVADACPSCDPGHILLKRSI